MGVQFASRFAVSPLEEREMQLHAGFHEIRPTIVGEPPATLTGASVLQGFVGRHGIPCRAHLHEFFLDYFFVLRERADVLVLADMTNPEPAETNEKGVESWVEGAP